MGGVLLAHWEHEFIDDTVKIVNECPFGVCEVQFRSVVWAPKLGQKLCKPFFLFPCLVLIWSLEYRRDPLPIFPISPLPSLFKDVQRFHTTSTYTSRPIRVRTY